MQTAAGQRVQGFPGEAPGRVAGGHWAIFDSASWQAVRRSNWCSSGWSCIMLPVVVADGPVLRPSSSAVVIWRRRLQGLGVISVQGP